MAHSNEDSIHSQFEKLKLELSKLENENGDLKSQIKQLENTRNRIDRIFNLTLDFMIVKNVADDHFTHVNPAFIRAMGYSEIELTSQPQYHFIHPEDRAETEVRAQSVAQNGSLQNFENRYLTSGGRILWLSWTAVYDPTENMVYAVAKDVTRIKERELEIAQQKLEIAATSKMNALGRLAAGIAHEINNPLTIVSAQAFMLRQLVSKNAANQEDLLKITEQIEHMSSRIVKIINGLRALTRDDSNDAFESVSIKNIIEDTLAFCWRNFKAQGINLTVDDVPEDLHIKARPVQMSQVLLNLLNNAYDVAVESRDKWIRVAVNVTETSVEMKVIDSGAGIAPELRPQLFDAFFTTKPVGKGNGLGLNIAQTILASHGGEIYLDDSAPNTTFVVRLPRLTPCAT